jgi:hypothetical protein
VETHCAPALPRETRGRDAFGHSGRGCGSRGVRVCEGRWERPVHKRT